MLIPKNLLGRDLGLSAYAVYPAMQYIAKMAIDGKREWFDFSVSDIAEKAGLKVGTVRLSMDELLERRNYLIKAIQHPERQQRKTPVYIFTYNITQKTPHKNFFELEDDLIKFNIWADMLPRNKTLYLAILSASWTPENITGYIEGDIEAEEIVYRRIGYRWMVCNLHLRQIADIVGISYVGSRLALKELESLQLVYKMKNYLLVR